MCKGQMTLQHTPIAPFSRKTKHCVRIFLEIINLSFVSTAFRCRDGITQTDVRYIYLNNLNFLALFAFTPLSFEFT